MTHKREKKGKRGMEKGKSLGEVGEKDKNLERKKS